jgi:hypothetical protein
MQQLPPGRREGLIVEELDGELLVYDTERDRAHSLNAVAAAVWQACDGVRDPKAIAEAAGVTDDDVWRALSQLDERGLLAGDLPRRMSGPEYSRRQAVRRMGLIGASAAFAAPLVKSIAIPTSAYAQASCVPLNGQCGTFDGEVCNMSTFPPCCPAMNVACFPPSNQGNQCTCQTSS